MPISSNRMTIPHVMNTERYIGMGLTYVNGKNTWDLIKACVDGDLEKTTELVDLDSNLINSVYWYQTPIYFAVREGQTEIVRFLLKNGSDPALAPYSNEAWSELLEIAETRQYKEISDILKEEMANRFQYYRDFESLADAIKSYDQQSVEQILGRSSFLIHSADVAGNGPVHWAVMTHQLDLIERFGELEADLNVRRADGKTPGLLAIQGDYNYRWWRDVPAEKQVRPVQIVNRLLEAGADYELSVALFKQDIERVSEILDKDSKLANQLDSGNSSPLFYASLVRNIHFTKKLLELGADPNQPESLAPLGRALYESCSKNHYDQVRILLDAGANPDGHVDSSGNSYWIVQKRYPDTYQPVQKLLKRYGARRAFWEMTADEIKTAIDAKDEIMKNPDYAYILEKKDIGLLEKLLEYDPDFPQKLYGNDFRTDSVIFTANKQNMDFLLKHGLDINKRDWLGKTVLHYAAEFGDLEMVKYCVEHGGDIHAEEFSLGTTPLGIAADRGYLEVCAYLLEKGADPYSPKNKSWTQASYLAAQKGNTEISKLFDS